MFKINSMLLTLDKMKKRELELAVDQSFFWTDSTSVLKYVADYESHKVPYVCGEQVVSDPGVVLAAIREVSAS